MTKESVIWAVKLTRSIILCLLATTIFSCEKHSSREKMVFYSIVRDFPDSMVINYQMDQIKELSHEKREIRTYVFNNLSGMKEKGYASLFRIKELIVTQDSVYVGFSEKDALMTKATNTPIVYASPEYPSFFQFIKDTVIHVANKEYNAHYFITKAFYYDNDTLFLGNKSYDYFCDSDFQLIYTRSPRSPISCLFEDADGECLDVVISTRIDESMVPKRIARALRRKGRMLHKSDILLQ